MFLIECPICPISGLVPIGKDLFRIVRLYIIGVALKASLMVNEGVEVVHGFLLNRNVVVRLPQGSDSQIRPAAENRWYI